MDPQKTLASLPKGLRDPLVDRFREIANNYYERRWGPAELDGGKFCEVAYSVLDGATSGAFPASPSKPPNFGESCRALRNRPPVAVGDHSLRIMIPTVLTFLYDVRNKRGVGHIAGEVDSNFMDATAVFQMASWVLAELIRIFHDTTTILAQRAVDALIEFKHPLIWEVGTTRRVLDKAMSKSDQVLALLYGRVEGASESDLIAWTEYSNASVFRAKILDRLHADRLVEYHRAQRVVTISPLGVVEVEKRLLKTRVGLNG